MTVFARELRTMAEAGTALADGSGGARSNEGRLSFRRVGARTVVESALAASPLRILDCDMPVDGAVAVVLTRADRAGALRSKPVRIESLGHATGSTLDTEYWPDMTTMASRWAADEMWAGTDLGPADVDVAQLYDGFSSMTLCWLEDLGFVKKGEAGPWFAEGRGRLGGGRLHGFGKLAEAVKQLRGECGERQVEGAEVALACVGGGAIASAMLLVAG